MKPDAGDSSGRKTFSKVSGGERRITAAAELRRILTGRGLEQPHQWWTLTLSVNSKQRMYFY